MRPTYLYIHDKIKKAIDDHIWGIGHRLPSERDLACTFQVSRMTLRHALTLLVEEGVLERRVGSGTFVTSNNRVKEKIRGTEGFTDVIAAQGKVPSTKLISYYKTFPRKQEVEKLGIQTLSNIIRMERIRYADQIPVVYEVASIPEKWITGFKRDDIVNHFFKTLQENGYKIGKSHQTLYARLVGEKRIASYLQIPLNHAILDLTQVSYFDDGSAFEYVKSQYVGGRFEFYND